jgi:hypothetical protein
VGSVVQELCLHALLRHQRCLVLAHPSSNGKNTRPDYEVTQPDGSVFILEARTSTIIPTGPVNEQRRNRIVDRLRELRLDGLALGFAEVSAGTRDLRWASLEGHIRTELAKFRGRTDSFSIPTFIKDGWRVRLTALAALDGLDDGDLRFEAWSGRAVNMAEVLLATLRKKGGRYGSLDAPFVIALNTWEVMCGTKDIQAALFGDRDMQGFWGSANNPKHTRVSAVLFTTNLWPATILLGQKPSQVAIERTPI